MFDNLHIFGTPGDKFITKKLYKFDSLYKITKIFYFGYK